MTTTTDSVAAHLGEPPKLGYLPAWDGLRALAVVAVMLFHFDIPGFRGGLLGVDVFFVISGFLITYLLLGEVVKHGHIEYRRFIGGGSPGSTRRCWQPSSALGWSACWPGSGGARPRPVARRADLHHELV